MTRQAPHSPSQHAGALSSEDRPTRTGWARRKAQLADAGFALAVFVLVASASFMLLSIDFRDLRQRIGIETARIDAGTDASTGTVPMDRPRLGDQTRPYLPASRPIAPGRDLPRNPDWPVASEAAPMTFTRTGSIVHASGTITPGTAARFDRFAAAEGDTDAPFDTVVLHSPGGLVDEAIALARHIRAADLRTRVPAEGYCASSCPLVFAGGTERIAHKDAWIGVHRAFVPPDTFGSMQDGIAAAQEVSAAAQDLLHGFGVDALVWTFAMRTPKEQLYFFTTDQLTDLRLATRIEGGAEARSISVPLPRPKPDRDL